MNEIIRTPDISSFTQRAKLYFEKESHKLNLNITHYLEPSYQEHFSRNQEAIIQAIDGLKNTALIFGAGGMNDLPIVKIAEQFTSVILVDVNLNYTEEALKELPENLRSKFYLIQADLVSCLLRLK
jgi:basic membrane lipoprotein Med (substrate-binding protein (PBP1-ABC) superfamily)